MLAKISDAGAKANCYLSCFNDLLVFPRKLVTKASPMSRLAKARSSLHNAIIE